MNAIAIIGRELRAESRRSVNFWLRGLSLGVLTVLAGNFMVNAQVPLSQLGPALFSLLHKTLFYGFLVVAPLMTADCISRERREGTLPLLFLTPLTFADVIAGKSAVQILRTFTLFLAALPVLVMPFFLGGIEWQVVVVSVLGVLSVILLGIVAGLLASVAGGTTIQVMVRAELFSAGLVMLWEIMVAGSPYGSAGQFVFFLARCSLFCAALFLFVLRMCIHRLRQTWHEMPAAPSL